ncbi:DUF1653 domain-containing protein [Undibacterium fentianense]|uniref:DUF1653 domain-containing protein n=1 Tax=Undibacterium fentianense TaxID=2828728 RepID=A0A941DX99_9BURK|nr:DUF1653 domain-containing protein [Undibacterium fentianense]MBR7798430.1 DUF1653 domain-containing protein [Undibacterium fentianense]
MNSSNQSAVRQFRHYKGGIYELICEATNEADLQPVIVYRAANGSVWTRPKSVFFESILVDGQMVQRFTEIDVTHNSFKDE